MNIEDTQLFYLHYKDNLSLSTQKSYCETITTFFSDDLVTNSKIASQRSKYYKIIHIKF